jgi:PAS domain S-box-containing protein
MIGRRFEGFADEASRGQIAHLWPDLERKGEREGTLQLVRGDGQRSDVHYKAKGNVLPARHLVLLEPKSGANEWNGPREADDYALFLLDRGGVIVSWFGGAQRLYGLDRAAAVGRAVSTIFANPKEMDAEAAQGWVEEKLKIAGIWGHWVMEGWNVRGDGSLFWANAVTVALRAEDGTLEGFGVAARDFTSRLRPEAKSIFSPVRNQLPDSSSEIAGVVSGEFDVVREANDVLLDLLGYSREDILARQLLWPELTPLEFAAADAKAHEEGLRFGACAPYEKELICKNGERIPVMVMMAVQKICPFQWISWVQDLRARNRVETLEMDVTPASEDFGEILGRSQELRRLQRLVELVVPTDATVLILGETGTGKELVARAIHRLSPRSRLPFVTLNCAAIPTGLLESELFGYERGAFTGALTQKMGRFELAHRGTLFLDEVGDIPLDLQPKLLRALQEKSFERLGGTKTIPIDVRLVAATNRNLTQMMSEKLFRSDLYYRLKVYPIITPPLREHPEDVPILARHFTRKYAEKMGRKIDKIPASTIRALMNWPWPGNVRELENFIERAVILSTGSNLRAPLAEIHPNEVSHAGSESLEAVEREYILRVLRDSNGVVTTAALRLGIPRTTLNAMMRKLGISRRDLSI